MWLLSLSLAAGVLSRLAVQGPAPFSAARVLDRL